MKYDMNANVVLIWDDEEQPLPGDWHVVLWRKNQSLQNKNEVSIPTIVESEAISLRKKILAFIFHLGEIKIKNTTLIDYLESRSGFSYWWMTLLFEGNFNKITCYYDVVRCWVLADLLNELQPKKVILATKNKALVTVVKKLCKKSSIRFTKYRIGGGMRLHFNKKLIYSSLPHLIQACIYLIKYARERYPFTQNKLKPELLNKAEITFIDYFIHLDKNAVESGQFLSNFWTKLVQLMDENEIFVNWLHHYVKHEMVPNTCAATHLINQFNEVRKKQQRDISHSFIDEALSLSIIKKAIYDYFWLCCKSIKATVKVKKFSQNNCGIDLWPLLKRDWLRSLRGAYAMENCLIFYLLEKMISQLPKQKSGFYLLENQPWEMALVHIWKTAKHGRLVGVQHATVRFWDLCYFHDPQYYKQNAKNHIPLPDTVAVNGSYAFRAFLEANYPLEQLTEVEALRYLHLHKKKKCGVNNHNEITRILICCDYNASITEQMLNWLLIAFGNLEKIKKFKFIIKPHPFYAVDTKAYQDLPIEIRNDNLQFLLENCDLVYSSNTTSAVVEAYLYGLPVIQALDGCSFNFSPLRNLKGIVYISSPEELRKALDGNLGEATSISEPYFYLDIELPRWQKLLGIDSVVTHSSLETTNVS